MSEEPMEFEKAVKALEITTIRWETYPGTMTLNSRFWHHFTNEAKRRQADKERSERR